MNYSDKSFQELLLGEAVFNIFFITELERAMKLKWKSG